MTRLSSSKSSSKLGTSQVMKLGSFSQRNIAICVISGHSIPYIQPPRGLRQWVAGMDIAHYPLTGTFPQGDFTENEQRFPSRSTLTRAHSVPASWVGAGGPQGVRAPNATFGLYIPDQI